MGDAVSSTWDAATGAASDVASGIGDAVSGIGNAVGDLASSDLGKAGLIAAAVYFGIPPDVAAGMSDAELAAAATDAGGTVAADGTIDLGGGITMGADGSVTGGTFEGGTGLTGNAATDAATGLSSDSPSFADALSKAKQASTVYSLGKQLLGVGGAAAGARAGTGTGTGTGTGAAPQQQAAAPQQDNSFLPGTNLSYTAVDASPKMLNPVLANLAGVGTQAPIQPNNSDLILGTSQGAQPKSEVPESYAHGGLTSIHPVGEPEFYSEGGLGNMYIQGKGDGTSDDIPAMVANNEFVVPADIVSALGNGSSEAGGSVLDQFVKNIREHKHSNSPDELPPQSKGPLAYLPQKGRA